MSEQAAKEIEKPKTSEYRYFKKMKPSNNQSFSCFESLKSENNFQRLEVRKHYSGQKSLSIELKKTTLQSNFQLETSGSVDSKLGLQKACAPCNMLGDVDGLGHVYCGDNLLEKENLNIHQADQFSLSLPWKVEEIHQHGSGVYQSSILHGVRMPTNSEDVDFDADSACNSRKLNQGIDFGHETVPDNRFQNCPDSLFHKAGSYDSDLTWIPEDFPFFPAIQNSSGCQFFESFPLKGVELGLTRWNEIYHKPENTYFAKDIAMQLLDHRDGYKHHMQEFIPETGMILRDSPKNSVASDPLLGHEGWYKHHRQELIPETGSILWVSPTKLSLCNSKCNGMEDFHLGDVSQDFLSTVALWDNDQENAGPKLGFCLSGLQQQNGTDNWDPRKSFPCFFPTQIDLSEGQHKLIDKADVLPFMKNGHCSFAQEGHEIASLFTSLPYSRRDRLPLPVKLPWRLENPLDVPDTDQARGKEWESLAMPIHAGRAEMIQSSNFAYGWQGAECLYLSPYSDFSSQRVCQTSGKGVAETSGLNGADYSFPGNHQGYFFDEVDNEGLTCNFNCFEKQFQSTNMRTPDFLQFPDRLVSNENRGKSFWRSTEHICVDSKDVHAHELQIVPYSSPNKCGHADECLMLAIRQNGLHKF
eukprot:Gb_05597 [translate_table: standard]